MLTDPQKHTVRAGDTEIGSLEHRRPTLSAPDRGTDLGDFKVDPLLVGVGIGWRF